MLSKNNPSGAVRPRVVLSQAVSGRWGLAGLAPQEGGDLELVVFVGAGRNRRCTPLRIELPVGRAVGRMGPGRALGVFRVRRGNLLPGGLGGGPLYRGRHFATLVPTSKPYRREALEQGDATSVRMRLGLRIPGSDLVLLRHR